MLAPVLAPVTTPGHLALLPQVAYTHLDDNILTVIDLSDKKELAPAQAILQRIHARQLYKFLDQTQPTDERVAEAGLFDAVGTLACRTCFLCPVVSLLFVEPSFFHFVASVVYPSCARPALGPLRSASASLRSAFSSLSSLKERRCCYCRGPGSGRGRDSARHCPARV